MVTVNFLNFKFSVLGEVGHVGTFEVKGDRITLLEALAMAGDLTPRSVWTVSPSSANMGTSDESCSTTSAVKTSSHRLTIYLQQNDIVYVEPTNMKATEQAQRKPEHVEYDPVLHHHNHLTGVVNILIKMKTT